MIPALTSSEMSAFQNCPRGWWLQYYRKLRPVREEPSKNATIGNIFHAVLEQYYRGKTRDEATAYAETVVSQLLDDWDSPDVHEAAEMAAIMLDGYFEHVEDTGADADYQVIGAEEQIEVALPDTPFRLRGKVDARLLRLSDGAKLQLEHKTVGSLLDLPKYAQSAPQFLTYDLLAHLKERQEGTEVRTDGVLLNMAKRVKRTVRATPPFYARHPVYHNLDELRAHFRHVVAIGEQIQRARLALEGGANHHDVCPPRVNRDHVWSCACAPVTTMFDDGMSDPEGFLAEWYEPFDPWERYSTEGET